MDRLLKTISPSAIITGYVPDYTKHCIVPFGTYCQIHNKSDNTMRARTTCAIVLHPTGNIQGSHCFYSFNTPRPVTSTPPTYAGRHHQILQKDCPHSKSKENIEMSMKGQYRCPIQRDTRCHHYRRCGR